MSKIITAKDAGKSEKSDKLSQVYKKQEFTSMLELISKGIWKNVNLANALHVSVDTITDWKRSPEAEKAHREAILKFAGRRTDVENILKELGMEIDSTEVPLLNVTINSWSDDQLKQYIESETARRITGGSLAGIETQGEVQPAEILESTPQTD